jgi:hypothetical protein
MPKLLKSKPIQPLYTRGGTPIADGFDPLGPGAPINTPFPTEIQNPNQVEGSQIRGGAGTRGATPARTGAFGYGIRRRSFEQYNTPITDPRSQAPGAPITQRPIVPIDPSNPGGGAGANFDRGRRPGGSPETGAKPPSVRSISTPPPSSGMRATSLGRPLADVGVRAASVSRSTASTARTAVAPAPKASSSAAKNAVVAKPAAKKGSKTRLSRSMA